MRPSRNQTPTRALGPCDDLPSPPMVDPYITKILASRLSVQERMILVCLSRAEVTNDSSWPDMDQILDETGCSLEEARTAIKSLMNAGIIIAWGPKRNRGVRVLFNNLPRRSAKFVPGDKAIKFKPTTRIFYKYNPTTGMYDIKQESVEDPEIVVVEPTVMKPTVRTYHLRKNADVPVYIEEEDDGGPEYDNLDSSLDYGGDPGEGQ